MSRTSYGYSDYPRSYNGFYSGSFFSMPIVKKTPNQVLFENVKSLIGNYVAPRSTDKEIMEYALEIGIITMSEFNNWK